ncbi:MAG: hypothetical protein MJK04_18130 [Psychrosphaera sp.]|nr:hypothetical protein [Psychrosphaera sp.]
MSAEDIVIGKKYSIDSKALAEKREYWISLPSSYDSKDDKKYPVLYLIDASNDNAEKNIKEIQQLMGK